MHEYYKAMMRHKLTYTAKIFVQQLDVSVDNFQSD